jgi:hypothetical protein
MNYDELIESLQRTMEENSSEFQAELPLLVVRAQNYLQRRLDPPDIVTYVTVTGAASSRELALPSDLLVLKGVDVLVSSEQRPLLQQTAEWLTTYWPVVTSVGTPKYYAAKDNNSILLAPTLTSAFPFVVKYVSKVPLLSTSVSSNWFTENAENAFFFTAMMYANYWAKNPEMATAWKAQADEELTALNNEARRARRQDAADRTSGSPENNIQEGAR